MSLVAADVVAPRRNVVVAPSVEATNSIYLSAYAPVETLLSSSVRVIFRWPSHDARGDSCRKRCESYQFFCDLCHG